MIWQLTEKHRLNVLKKRHTAQLKSVSNESIEVNFGKEHSTSGH